MTTENRAPVLAEVVAVLEHLYDPSWARDWDRVGLVCGDPRSPVRRVLLAVDPISTVVEEALEWNADLVITHHPLLLQGVHSVAATTAKGRLIHQLVRGDCALYTAHTNADVAAPGVSDALARVLGLRDLQPLSADAPDPVDKLVTFVPHDSVDQVVDALSKAGAGQVGANSRCAFIGEGTATLVPPGTETTTSAASAPAEGAQGHTCGRRTDQQQRRVEMITPRAARTQVLAALRSSHPNPDPTIDLYEVASWSSARGIGRIGRLDAATTLREFALLVAEALPATAQGVRIAGDPNAIVKRVAVCGGSGDSLIGAARAAGVDAFVTADLRHHPTSEARENDGEGTPFLVDVAHWASEWPWLAGVANRIEGLLEASGTPIEVAVSARCTDPWTFRVPSAGGIVR